LRNCRCVYAKLAKPAKFPAFWGSCAGAPTDPASV